MPIRTAIWKVGLQPEPLSESLLAKEQLLEDIIVAAPNLLSEEWMLIVPVRWLQTVPLEKAIQEIGLFGIPLVVCRPTTPKWRSTVERLKQEFADWNK